MSKRAGDDVVEKRVVVGWQLGETLFNASQYGRARAALYESHELGVSRHSAQNWSAQEDPAEQPPAPGVPAVAEEGAARGLVFFGEQVTYGLSAVDQWEDPRPEEAQVALEFAVVDEPAGNVILCWSKYSLAEGAREERRD